MAQTLEDVLNEYVAEVSRPSIASLKKWIRLYPQYKHELAEFTDNWVLVNLIEAERENNADATIALG